MYNLFILSPGKVKRVFGGSAEEESGGTKRATFGGTQTGSYQTGSYQKGRFIPPKPKRLHFWCLPGETSLHKATTDTYFWGRFWSQFANLAFGNNPFWYDSVYMPPKLAWTRHFCACGARRGNSQRLAKSSPYAGPSACTYRYTCTHTYTHAHAYTYTHTSTLIGIRIARKLRVWRLLGRCGAGAVETAATSGSHCDEQKMLYYSVSSILICYRICYNIVYIYVW